MKRPSQSCCTCCDCDRNVLYCCKGLQFAHFLLCSKSVLLEMPLLYGLCVVATSIFTYLLIAIRLYCTIYISTSVAAFCMALVLFLSAAILQRFIRRRYQNSFDAQHFIYAVWAGFIMVFFATCFAAYCTQDYFVQLQEINSPPIQQFTFTEVSPSDPPPLDAKNASDLTNSEQNYFIFTPDTAADIRRAGWTSNPMDFWSEHLCAAPLINKQNQRTIYFWAVGECRILQGKDIEVSKLGWNQKPALGIQNSGDGDESHYWDAVEVACKEHNVTHPESARLIEWSRRCEEVDMNKKAVPFTASNGTCFPCNNWPECKEYTYIYAISVVVGIAMVWPLPFVIGYGLLSGYLTNYPLHTIRTKNDESMTESFLEKEHVADAVDAHKKGFVFKSISPHSDKGHSYS